MIYFYKMWSKLLLQIKEKAGDETYFGHSMMKIIGTPERWKIICEN